MSIFASHTRQTIPLPQDPSQTITIRKLTGREVERAQGEHLRGLISESRGARGWAEAFKRQLGKGVVPLQQLVTDPLNGYDRQTIITSGLLGWSFTDPPFTPAAVADLDDDAAEFIARAILQLSKPALFVTDATEETHDA